MSSSSSSSSSSNSSHFIDSWSVRFQCFNKIKGQKDSLNVVLIKPSLFGEEYLELMGKSTGQINNIGYKWYIGS